MIDLGRQTFTRAFDVAQALISWLLSLVVDWKISIDNHFVHLSVSNSPERCNFSRLSNPPTVSPSTKTCGKVFIPLRCWHCLKVRSLSTVMTGVECCKPLRVEAHCRTMDIQAVLRFPAVFWFGSVLLDPVWESQGEDLLLSISVNLALDGLPKPDMLHQIGWGEDEHHLH